MGPGFAKWWSAMATMEQVYWTIAIPASVIFLFIMVSTFFGGDMETDTDIDVETDIEVEGDSGIPFQFITLKNIIGFFTIFSWTGLAFIKGGYGLMAVIFSSTFAGLLMMVVMSTIFYLMNKLAEDGNIDLKKAVGSVGEVYLTIQGGRKSMGKVQMKIEGTFQTLDALTDDEQDINTGRLVDIIDITNNNILIVKSSSK